MKRALSFLLAAMMLLSLTACGGGAQAPAADEEEAAAPTAEPTTEPTEEPTPTPEPTPEPTPAPEYRLVSVKERYAEENWAEYGYTFSYENGGCLPSTYQQQEVGFAPYIYTLGYDGAGRLISERYEPSDNDDEYFVDSYTYDEQGNLIKTEIEHYFHGYRSDEEINGSTFDVTEYTYDADGNFLSAERTFTDYDGTVTEKEASPVETKEDRAAWREFLYSVQYSLPLLGAGYSGDDFTEFNVWLDDSAGQTIFSAGVGNGVLTAEPELTYDDNGYLIRADDGAGNYLELTYEPVT